MKEIRIGFEIGTLNNLIKRYIEYSSHKNEIETITGNNSWIIGFLGSKEEEGKEVYQKDIEDHFNITRSTVSNVLNLMEQKGLIQRQTVEQDARLKKIVLTKKANDIKGIMKKDIDQMEAILTEGFTNEELETFIMCMQRMKNNISKQ